MFYDDRLVDSPIFPFSLSTRGEYSATTGRNWSHRHIWQDAEGYWWPEDSTDQCAWERLPGWIDKDYFRVLVGVKVDNENGGVVTCDDLRTLSRVGWVKWLALDGADEIGDEDLEYIGRLRQLERLYLADSRERCRPKASAGLTNLRYLSLAGTRITDAGVAELESLAKLEMLELCDTAVSDASIVRLKRFKKLASLYLHQTRVTKNGVEQLRTGLPGCVVTMDSPGSVELSSDP